MRKGLTFLLSTVAAVAMTVSASADPATDPSTVVARVNGEEITLGHIIVTFAALPKQYQGLEADVLYHGLLDQLIQQTALAQIAKPIAPLFVALSVENERRSLLAAEEINRVMERSAGGADVLLAYDAQYSEGFGGPEFNASHILLDTEEEANLVKSMLDSGSDFSELAKLKSTGPSGPNGGSLGWFGMGRMVPEFEVAVMTLKRGQVSNPIQTQFGWHVIILNEKRQAKAPPLDQVRDEIITRLRNEAIEEYVAALTADAIVERPVIKGLNPEIMRDLNLVRH